MSPEEIRRNKSSFIIIIIIIKEFYLRGCLVLLYRLYVPNHEEFVDSCFLVSLLHEMYCATAVLLDSQVKVLSVFILNFYNITYTVSYYQ